MDFHIVYIYIVDFHVCVLYVICNIYEQVGMLDYISLICQIMNHTISGLPYIYICMCVIYICEQVGMLDYINLFNIWQNNEL